MTWSSYTDFCVQCSIPDNDNCQLKTIDTTFIASNVVQGKKNPLVPDRAFVRYQFLEAVVRLALAKFERAGMRPAQCIDRLMDVHVGPACATYFKAFAQFREDILWTEEVRQRPCKWRPVAVRCLITASHAYRWTPCCA